MILSIGLCSSCTAQQTLEIERVMSYDTYSTQSSSFFTNSLHLINKESFSVILWLDNDIIADYSEEGKIKTFFFKRSYDFNLFDLISENLLKNDDLMIGHSLYKTIPPGETFEIHFFSNEKIEVTQIESFLDNHLVILGLEDVENTILLNNLQSFGFQSNDLIIALPIF